MFTEKILNQFLAQTEKFSANHAFCIGQRFYSYQDFARTISRIRKAVQVAPGNCMHIGIIANDDIETYAAIFAVWLEGRAYVPLHPQQSLERNREIISQAGIGLVISSDGEQPFTELPGIDCRDLEFDGFLLEPTPTPDSALAYILFTSGSTGKPKGVPLSRGNVGAFVDAFWDLGYRLDETDRVLQPFELTFDLSVMCYLIPVLKGACVYTVPANQIKCTYIAEILEEHAVTFALVVPTTVRYLRPYFDEIQLPALRYSLFCGEALPLDLVTEWSRCVPNARIDNVYGPTEDTIFCSCYTFLRAGGNKACNGILSIGRSMSSGELLIVDPKNQAVPVGEQGELCLAGAQLTTGYWNNPEKNMEVFFTGPQGQRFYRTGDICRADADGDMLYVGRLDSQVKIQGFRVELGEIEHHAREFLKNVNAVAVAFQNKMENTEIALFIETDAFEKLPLLDYLRTKIPYYMMPTHVGFNREFPLNSNGKIDRNVLKKSIAS